MLVVCFGIHKSASTFAYRLITEASRRLFSGEVMTGKDVKRVNNGYIERNTEVIKNDQKLLIQKTHAGTDTDIGKLVNEGQVKAIASIRDPRDVALSMLDAGKKERELGRKNDIAKIFTLAEATSQIKSDIHALMRWYDLSNCHVIPYVEIKEKPSVTVGKIVEIVLDKKISSEECEAIVASISRDTIRLNRGIHQRYLTEMSESDSETIKNSFKEFYERFESMV